MNQRKLSGQIFDLARLQRKQKRINYQRLKHQRMMSALELCNSSYINSSFQNKQIIPLKDQPKQKNLQKENINRLKLIQDKIYTNIHDLIYEVINQININKANNKIQQENNNKQDLIQQHKLSESNQNFIIELFNRLNLLDKYKQTDRSFLRLVKEAQSQFYQSKSFNREKLSTKLSSKHNIHNELNTHTSHNIHNSHNINNSPNTHNSHRIHQDNKELILKQDKSISNDLQQTNIRFQETLNGFSNIISEDQQKVCGYSEVQESLKTQHTHFFDQFQGNLKTYYTKRFLGSQQVQAYHQIKDILTNFKIR